MFQLQFQGLEALWLPFDKIEVEKPFGHRQFRIQDQDRKASWSPHLSRIISRVFNYQLSQVFLFFVKR